MMMIDPEQVFSGVVLVAAPHMDDEILACGGSLAGLRDKGKVHVVYATDGRLSPVPVSKPASLELEAIRMQEAREALSILGLPEQNMNFLRFPDGSLKRLRDQLTRALAALIRSIQPEKILVPFRYDRHPDHLALYRATMQAVAQEQSQAEIYEYFVYNRYRLLPGGDIREYIRPNLMVNVDTRAWSELKKEALMHYRSQTTLFYSWQTRPILPQKRVDEVSRQPEVFLKYAPDFPGISVFLRGKYWIYLVHSLEPQIKNCKERTLSLLRAGRVIDGRQRR